MTAPSLFEIIPFTTLDDLEAPTNGPYYVATQDGYMAMQSSHFGPTLTPVKSIPSLPKGTPAIWKQIPKLPASIIGQAWSFFRATYKDKKSEAMVDITWSEEKGYRLFVPPQQASYGGVKAERNPEHIHGLHVGTIHSHCNFTAYHSGTDQHDADQHNGLHLTIGKVDQDKPEIAIMISQNGVKWDLTLDEIMDGDLVLTEHPQRWEHYVSPPKKTVTSSSTPRTTQPSGLVVYNGRRNQAIAQAEERTRRFFEDEGYWDAHQNYGTLLAAAHQADLIPDHAGDLQTIQEALDSAQKALDKLGIDLDFEFRIQVPHAKPTTIYTEDDIPAEWRHLFQ